jgi:hypothetical protein
MKKIKEWIKRYVPAEIFATIGTILGAGFLYGITQNRIAAVYAGVIGENIGYYGFILICDLKKSKNGASSYLKTIRNLILEFGFPEMLDSFLVRPFCLYWFSLWMPNYTIGIFIGKIIADVVFYIPTIIAYELRKKYARD